MLLSKGTFRSIISKKQKKKQKKNQNQCFKGARFALILQSAAFHKQTLIRSKIGPKTTTKLLGKMFTYFPKSNSGAI